MERKAAPMIYIQNNGQVAFGQEIMEDCTIACQLLTWGK